MDIKFLVKATFTRILKMVATNEDIDHFVILFQTFIRVRNGRIAHATEFSGLVGRLRRNLHKLEKGICHHSRKKNFAEYLIKPIISDLLEYKNRKGRDYFYKYSISVLSEYAAVSELSHESKELIDLALLDEHRQTGMTRDWSTNNSSLEAAMENRRSIRTFSEDVIPAHEIKRIVDTALTSPSACNRQPFRVFVSNSGDCGHRELCNVPLGTSGWSDKIPTILFIIGDWSNFSNPRDHLVPITDGSLFAMQLMLLLTKNGYGSCPINWSDVPEKNRILEELLQLKPYEKCIMSIAMGHPIDHPTPLSAKKAAHEIISNN